MLESHWQPNKPEKNRQQQDKLKTSPIAIAGIFLLILGGLSWFTWYNRDSIFLDRSSNQSETVRKSSSLVPLLSQSPPQRAAQLKAIAIEKKVSRDRSRARYLLGIDLLQQHQGAAALEYLAGLETDYPLLAPQILWKTALAYQKNQQQAQFQTTLKHLIQTYPNSPVVADALPLLSSNHTQYQQRLIEQFPDHHHTQNLARQLLEKNPQQFELLLLLAKYSRDSDLNPLRDRLVLEYPAQLTTEDWEAIADGYWREEEHRKAADAYTLAPSTPHNLYRAARGFHRNGNIGTARRAYQRLLQEYHDAREAGLALLHLASISSGDEAIVYLERAIALFPELAPKAYLSKALVHDAFGKSEAANLAKQKLLNEYADSATTAAYRWKMARKLANQGKKQEAWQWMNPVVKSNLDLDFAPKALYWTGKWAKETGNLEAAHTAWERTLALYPQSYWAWRAAVALGWDVGNFANLNQLNPSLDFSRTYSPLPMGSEAVQELYFLGQYQDAQTLLQSEIERPQKLTVNEQFTEGLILLKLGQISRGMQQIWDLAQREDPQDRQQWQSLRKTEAYWYGLFPFPYREEILQYAKQESINPLLVISVMRKESTFAPEIDSRVGAVGLMQILPATAQWVAEQIELNDYSLTKPEDNIKIGTWYLAHNHHRYDNNSLLAIASYNAGTGNVNAWLKRYDLNNGDRFVEQIPFPETQDYVEGVLGNYWNYLRLYNPQMREKVNNYQAKINH